MKVICNRAHQFDYCDSCAHSKVHEAFDDEGMCTTWNDCYDWDNNLFYKIRCISIDSRQGQEIMKRILLL